jgi:hypothetical protein
MWQLDFLYPVSVALDIVALVATVFFPMLGLGSITRFGRRDGRITSAYLGYICCAVLVASFTLHFGLDGGEVYMMFLLWLIPFAVAAAVALLMTFAIASNGALWTLAVTTTMLGLAQAFAERQPGGIGGTLATLMFVVYCAYAVLVLGVSAYRHVEWWRWSHDQA